MMKYNILICIILFNTTQVVAQNAQFVVEGEIEYEKTVNMYTVLKKNGQNATEGQIAAYEQYKKTQPQFLKLKSKMLFSKMNIAYLPEPSVLGVGLNYFGPNPWYMQLNKVFSNLLTDSSVIQKEVLNDLFIVKDKRLSIKWKITDETREIAGFSCRRANGLVNDSVYLVAFYTNKIPIPAGPESFHGLPGMILGLALPYENVTWFATQVVGKKNNINSFAPPKKGKITTRKELEENLRKSLKQTTTFPESMLLGYLL